MRKCTNCKEEFPESEFFFKNKETGKLHSHCKSCKREMDKRTYKNNESRRVKIRTRATANKEKNKDFVNRVRKRSSCTRCGEKRWYVLDFHHKNSKLYNISDIMKRGYSIELIKDEIRKCEILCANCHREVHFLENLEKKLTG